MVKPGEVYSWEETWTAPSTAAKTWVGPKVEEGKVVRLEILAICDETTVNRSFRLGYDRAGTKHWVKAGNAGASSFDLALDVSLILAAGEAPAAYSSTHASSDVVHILARGVYL